ncbi:MULTISPECIES: MoaD family protein [Burkholderia]|uniref:MoaD family protein n=1 Tax=Burkholderia TaxID=32008 RepID=UPI00110F68C3|nr:MULTISPECIES: MoaD family protein [Burkholderia]MBR8174374.1 MoaD family protein [Burkholderia ambifaria]MBR8255328.1 MoaD family protein [Burkholderia ambifaria]QDW53945.1 MoaD/ThiS family protein [Burkholderia sp. KBS0801]
MAIMICIPTIMRTLTNDRKVVEAQGDTLRAVIDSLESTYPGLQQRLVEDNRLHRFVNVYVNDDDIRFRGGLSAAVADGDTITILPAVAGGRY